MSSREAPARLHRAPSQPHLPGQRVTTCNRRPPGRELRGGVDLPGVGGHTAGARDAFGGRPGMGKEGADFVWGMGWHSGAQGTRTLSPAVARLTRLISASLLSCRALSKPNAFPPAGDKEAAGKQGDLPGHATPPSYHACRASRTGDDSGTSGAGQRRDSRRLPWNLLLTTTDMVCALLRSRRGTTGRKARLVQSFSGVWQRDPGAEGPRGRTHPAPLATRLPRPSPRPRAPRASKRLFCWTPSPPPPLYWRTRKMHNGTALSPRPRHQKRQCHNSVRSTQSWL